MNHINQFTIRTKANKFKSLEVMEEKIYSLENFKPVKTVKKAYNLMNEWFGLEGNVGAQIIYYGILVGSLGVLVMFWYLINVAWA